jgi:hypothetical protein
VEYQQHRPGKGHSQQERESERTEPWYGQDSSFRRSGRRMDVSP